jgi:hypothetical protein
LRSPSLATFSSVTFGVGRSEREKSRRPQPALLPRGPPPSLASGVGIIGDDEESGSGVGSAGVGRSYKPPPRVVPQGGKVTEDSDESQPKVVCDVLQQHMSGSKYPNGTGDVGPEVSLIRFSELQAGRRERLTGVAGREPRRARQVGEVEGLEVAVERHVRVAVPEDALGAFGEVDVPEQAPAAECAQQRHVETAVARAQRAHGDDVSHDRPRLQRR